MQNRVEIAVHRRVLHVSPRLLKDSLTELRSRPPLQIMTNEFRKINSPEKSSLSDLMTQRRGELNPVEAYKHHEVLALTHWLLRRQHVRSIGQPLTITQEQVDRYLLWLAEMNSLANSEELPQKMLNEIANIDRNAADFVAEVTGLGTLRKAGYLGAMDVFFPMVNVKPQNR